MKILPTLEELRTAFDEKELLAGIQKWIEIESPSSDIDAVNVMQDQVYQDAQEAGLEVKRIPGKGFDAPDTVLATLGDTEAQKGILIACHVDTVHPIGTLQQMPFRVENQRIYGPGIADMKGGAYMALYACKQLKKLGIQHLPVTYFSSPDEEIGSHSTQDLLRQLAKQHAYALVTEAARNEGKIVVARKGTGHFQIKAHGAAAHTGINPQDGRSAVSAMARLALATEKLTDYSRGLTVNIGQFHGGTATNVVPEHCEAWLDFRFEQDAHGQEVVDALHELIQKDQSVKWTLNGGMNRPAMSETAESQRFFQTAKQLAADQNIDLIGIHTGGGSDANFTMSAGCPTLDGLGIDGGGMHTLKEYALLSNLKERCILFMRLLATLQ